MAKPAARSNTSNNATNADPEPSPLSLLSGLFKPVREFVKFQYEMARIVRAPDRVFYTQITLRENILDSFWFLFQYDLQIFVLSSVVQWAINHIHDFPEDHQSIAVWPFHFDKAQSFLALSLTIYKISWASATVLAITLFALTMRLLYGQKMDYKTVNIALRYSLAISFWPNVVIVSLPIFDLFYALYGYYVPEVAFVEAMGYLAFFVGVMIITPIVIARRLRRSILIVFVAWFITGAASGALPWACSELGALILTDLHIGLQSIKATLPTRESLNAALGLAKSVT